MEILLAPNGKPSNLSPEQYKLVRTPEFIAWFGDWLNDPENASKVVDENGEPLVCFHGSKSSDIHEFDLSKSKRKSSGLKEFGTYFTDNLKLAIAYQNWSELKPEEEKEIDIQILKWQKILEKSRNNRDYEKAEEQIKLLKKSKKGKIYEVFLNLKKMEVFNAKGQINIEAWNNLEVKASYKWAKNRDAMDFLKEGKFGVEKVDGIKAENIVDAFVQTEDLKKELLGNAYLVFDSKNIKLADGSNTTFDVNNPDIRFEGGGEITTKATLLSDLKSKKEKIEEARALLLQAFPYINSLDYLGGGLYGFAFLTEIDHDLFVVKLTNSITEFWASKMAFVSNAPNVVKFKDIKPLGKEFTYGLVHEYVDRDGILNEYAWNYAIQKENFQKDDSFLKNLKQVPEKEKEYVSEIAKKLSGEVEYFFGCTMDTLQQNWGYNSERQLVLFDVDGNIKKNQYLEWMHNYNQNNEYIRFDEGGGVPTLLAPNGKPSNLNAEQYKLVRSESFKKFFGDWEKLALAKINDSGIDDISLKRLEDGVSKVVDENGEPLVCFHGTFNDEFTIFRNSDIGAHFGTYEQAKRRVNSDKAFIKPFFLNIKNPLMLLDFDKGKWDGVAVGLMLRDSNILPMYIRIEIEEILEINEAKNGLSASKRQDNRMRELLESINYDGIIYNNEFEGEGRSFITFKPNQIKIANGKNTTFDFNNPDFTLAGGGSIDESETFYERTYADGTKNRFSIEEYEQNIYPDIIYAEGGGVKATTERFRPTETVNFNPPLIGTNGNKLVSYTWKYDYVVDVKEGEDISKRVSDWTQAETNAETGRDIVHVFDILDTNGKLISVSSESVPVALGFITKDQKKAFINLATSAKTLAKQQLQLSILKAKNEEIEKVRQEIIDAGYPEITYPESSWNNIDEDDLYMKMGEGWVVGYKSKPNDPERLGALKFSYINSEMKKRGLRTSKHDTYDLEQRIKRQEQKVQRLAELKPELFKGGGDVKEVLLAPNGKPTNLSKDQYELVRSKPFISWFGDWLNDPQNASKVLDKNGEPLVCFHGTNSIFTSFDKEFQNTKTGFGDFGAGFYFTSSFGTAKYYTLKSEDNRIVMSVFLKIMNPFIIELNWEKLSEQSIINYKELEGLSDLDKDFLNNTFKDDYRPSKAITKYFSDYGFQELLKRNNFDGVVANRINIYENPDVNHKNQIQYFNEIVCFEPNQIKLADGINTTFDSKNDDIRYEEGGKINELVEDVSTEFLNSIRNQDKSRWNYDLEKSIEKQGILEPVKIGYWSEYDKITLVDGHHRLDTAIDLDIKSIPTIIQLYHNNPIGKHRLYQAPKYNPNAKKPSDLGIFNNGGLIAPNGKPSNLSPEQYKLVRTPEFISWFGDWLKDPENASKVVDENGEPLVCFHATTHDFNVFSNNEDTHRRGVSKEGIFFTDSTLVAETYIHKNHTPTPKQIKSGVFFKENANIMPVFLSLQNPLIVEAGFTNFNAIGENHKHINDFISISKNHNKDGLIVKNVKDLGSAVDFLKDELFATTYIAFEPNQIKSAIGNNGNLDPNNPDIRFEDGGFVSYKDKYNKKFGYPKDKSHNLEQISKDTNVSLKGLQQIYNKGIGAFKTNPSSVRPTVKSKEQWAMARVYSAVMGGKTAKIDSNELKMKIGGKVPDNYIYVVNNFGSGEALNKVFNEWKNIQSDKDQSDWSMRIKLLRFGTYGQFDLFYVMEKFDFDKSDKINGILKRDFKKEVQNAYDNKSISINKNNEMEKESETFGGGGGVTAKSSHTLNSSKGKIAINLDKKWSDIDILLVPISFLVKCSEFNRRNDPKYSLEDSSKNIENIKKSFIENGITEPLIFSYIKNESKLLLLEGNHRLNALIELEVPYFPVCVTTIDSWAKGKGKGVKTKIKPYFATEIGKSRYTSVDNFEGVPYVNIENNHVDVNETDTLTINVPLLIRLFEYIREDVDNDAQIHFLTENLLKLKNKPELSMIDYDSIIDGIKIKKTAEKILALGGLAEGPPHSKGGIPLVVKSTGQNIEIEGGELVVNKFSSSETEKFEFEGKELTPCEIVSELNSMDNNGVEIDCNKIVGRFKK